MENVTKAFYMAAGLLIAIMILGIFLYLFKTGAIFGETYQLGREQEVIDKFNSKFEAYARNIERGETKEGGYDVIYDGNSIFDVISLANLAYDINEKNYNDNKNRVEIEIRGLDTVLSIGIALDETFQFDKVNVLEKGSFFKSSIDNIQVTTETIAMNDLITNTEIVNEGKLNDAKIVDIILPNGNVLKERVIYRYYFNCADGLFYSTESGKVNKMIFEVVENEDFDDFVLSSGN